MQDLRLNRNIQGGCRFIGDNQSRFRTRQRHRDHRPLPHTAAQLVGVFVSPFFRFGNFYEIEELNRFVPRRPGVQFVVNTKHVGDLFANFEHRIETRHRLLKDHANTNPAQRPVLFGGNLQQVTAVKVNLAPFNLRRGVGRSPVIAWAVTLFPHPDSPTRATVSPLRISILMPRTARITPRTV